MKSIQKAIILIKSKATKKLIGVKNKQIHQNFKDIFLIEKKNQSKSNRKNNSNKKKDFRGKDKFNCKFRDKKDNNKLE